MKMMLDEGDVAQHFMLELLLSGSNSSFSNFVLEAY